MELFDPVAIRFIGVMISLFLFEVVKDCWNLYKSERI